MYTSAPGEEAQFHRVLTGSLLRCLGTNDYGLLKYSLTQCVATPRSRLPVRRYYRMRLTPSKLWPRPYTTYCLFTVCHCSAINRVIYSYLDLVNLIWFWSHPPSTLRTKIGWTKKKRKKKLLRKIKIRSTKIFYYSEGWAVPLPSKNKLR